MQHSNRRWRLRTAAAVVTAAVIATMLWVAPASAVVLDTWSRSTTGAAGSGTIEVKNGYVYNYLRIADTKADGHCAYVVTTFDHHDAVLHLWFSVGSDRVTDCGNGTTTFATSYMSLDDMASAFTDMIRVKVKVCRDINNASDNCSGTYQSPTIPPSHLASTIARQMRRHRWAQDRRAAGLNGLRASGQPKTTGYAGQGRGAPEPLLFPQRSAPSAEPRALK